MAPKLKVNWAEFGNEAATILREFTGNIVEGAAEDVEDFWSEGAYLLQTALMMKDDEAVQRVKDALRVVAERNRLRIINEKWASFERGIDLARRVALAAFGSVTSFV